MSLKRRERTWQSTTAQTNILVISDSGKLIFSRYGEEASQVIAALLHTLRMSTLHDERLGYGDLQQISTSSSKIVFRNAGHLTFVAIAYKDGDGECDIETNDYLQLQMEYVYTGILFLLTDNVQNMVLHDFDVRKMLGSSEEKLRALLSNMELPKTITPCFLGGIPVLSPIPANIRQYSTKILVEKCSKQPSIVYAILSVNKYIFAICQPRNPMYQFLSADLNLFMEFMDGQVTDTSKEVWFPVCLPRLSTTGFLHCYQSIFGCDLKITLISQKPTDEELSMLREIANSIRQHFGFESHNENVLQVFNLKDSDSIGDNSYFWRRISSNIDDDDDTRNRDLQKDTTIHRYLLSSIKKALNPVRQEKLMDEYCDMANMQHFLFRCNIPIRDSESGAVCGSLPQIFGPSFDQTSCHAKYWKMYQYLSLIPRKLVNPEAQLSSETFRSALALKELCGKDSYENLYYFEDGDEVFVVYWNMNYELYGVMEKELSSYDTAFILCSTLAESLMHKQNDFFISSPHAVL